MIEQVKITVRQREYIQSLRAGPKTTHDLVISEMVSASSITKAMKGLQRLGFVMSETVVGGGRGQRLRYSLAGDYDVLMENVVIGRNGYGSAIHNEDVACALRLRLAGCTGQELYREFRKERPYRTDNAIKNIVNNARRHPEWQ